MDKIIRNACVVAVAASICYSFLTSSGQHHRVIMDEVEEELSSFRKTEDAEIVAKLKLQDGWKREAERFAPLEEKLNSIMPSCFSGRSSHNDPGSSMPNRSKQ